LTFQIFSLIQKEFDYIVTQQLKVTSNWHKNFFKRIKLNETSRGINLPC